MKSFLQILTFHQFLFNNKQPYWLFNCWKYQTQFSAWKNKGKVNFLFLILGSNGIQDQAGLDSSKIQITFFLKDSDLWFESKKQDLCLNRKQRIWIGDSNHFFQSIRIRYSLTQLLRIGCLFLPFPWFEWKTIGSKFTQTLLFLKLCLRNLIHCHSLFLKKFESSVL